MDANKFDARTFEQRIDRELKGVRLSEDVKQRIVVAAIAPEKPRRRSSGWQGRLVSGIQQFLNMEITVTGPGLALVAAVVVVAVGMYVQDLRALTNVNPEDLDAYRQLLEALRQRVEFVEF